MSKYAQFIVTNLKNEFHIPQYLHSYEAALEYYNMRPHDEDITDWVIICRPELKDLKRVTI